MLRQASGAGRLQREGEPLALPLSPSKHSITQFLLGKALLSAKDTDLCGTDLTFRGKSFRMRRRVGRNLGYSYLLS